MFYFTKHEKLLQLTNKCQKQGLWFFEPENGGKDEMFLYILFCKTKCIHKWQHWVICWVRVPFDLVVAVFPCAVIPTKPQSTGIQTTLAPGNEKSFSQFIQISRHIDLRENFRSFWNLGNRFMKIIDQVYQPLVNYTPLLKEYKIICFSGRNLVKTKIKCGAIEFTVKVLILTTLSSRCYSNIITIGTLIKPFQNTQSADIKSV